MGPKRRRSYSRARGALALPFVMTAASCTVTKSDSSTTPNSSDKQHEQQVISNPPPPTEAESKTKSLDPRGTHPGHQSTSTETSAEGIGDATVVTNPPAPQGQTPPDAPDDASLYTDTQGRCWETHEVSCPKGATCNPPPPTQVACPSDD